MADVDETELEQGRAAADRGEWSDAYAASSFVFTITRASPAISATETAAETTNTGRGLRIRVYRERRNLPTPIRPTRNVSPPPEGTGW